MIYNKFKLNKSKKEVLVIGAQQRSRPEIGLLWIGNESVFPTASGRNFGVIFANATTLERRVPSLSKSAFSSDKKYWKN